MKTGALLFRLTAIVVFLQIALGGLLTFNFISPAPHIVVGFLVLILALSTMVFALIAKPPFKPAQRLSIGLVVLIIVQIVLGFATLESGNSVIAWIHLLNALAIYGMSIAGIFLTIQWNRMLDSNPGQSRTSSPI